ncbi:GntR family transcriptional regulator [Ventosimonas gracilis]|uniref:GntR family transcriptional regulator n=1 Tax=Ventosimonas gracilis TaxID=1680762 RepID=A0A139SSE0_9GAMM|nr:GntR family transcriptional regulator [Ventosimonas gracilis]KXU37506.1 GntR family transcriptional regulator [Ventosimonas gracilis]
MQTVEELDNAFEALRIETPPATLREIALERLRRAIIIGLFEPGARLIERKLCEQLGVSRSVIREVIRHLQAEGLVEVIGRQGPIVTRLNWTDAAQIYDIRAALESRAVEDCARCIDKALKTQLAEALDEIDRKAAAQNPLGILDATTRFYQLIFSASGHLIAWDIVSRLNSRISRLRVMTLSTPERTRQGPAQIRMIFNAIVAADAQAAGVACRAHIKAAAHVAQQLLSEGKLPI